MPSARPLQEEKEASDFGATLCGFLDRYGSNFDYVSEAVAPASGGIVTKASVVRLTHHLN